MPYLAHPDSVDLGYEFMTLYYAGRCAAVALGVAQYNAASMDPRIQYAKASDGVTNMHGLILARDDSDGSPNPVRQER